MKIYNIGSNTDHQKAELLEHLEYTTVMHYEWKKTAKYPI